MFSQKNWRQFFNQSIKAKDLEQKLKAAPYSMKLIEHNDGKLVSTANTDVKAGIINVDVTQAPLKTALSYAYELKNYENKEKLAKTNQEVQEKSITKSQYIKKILLIEAEAAYFRCEVFRDLRVNDNEFPNKKEFLNLYDAFKDSAEAITIFHIYMIENGIVRNQFSAKKYYASSYDFFTNRRNWPKEYDQKGHGKTIELSP